MKHDSFMVQVRKALDKAVNLKLKKADKQWVLSLIDLAT
jgi:hypothetical protein